MGQKLSEYDWNNQKLQLLARHLFRVAIRDYAPQVLAELAGVPFDAALQVFGPDVDPKLRDDRRYELLVWGDLPTASKRDEDVGRLEAAISSWGSRFHLEDEWCLTMALQTLISWANDRF